MLNRVRERGAIGQSGECIDSTRAASFRGVIEMRCDYRREYIRIDRFREHCISAERVQPVSTTP